MATPWPGLTKDMAKLLKIRTNSSKKQLERVYEDLPAITKAHVRYDIKKAMRLCEARAIAVDIAANLTIGRENTAVRSVIVGSIRRRKPIIKDIDILIVLPSKSKQTLTALYTSQELMTYSRGARRRSMVVKSRRATVKVDFFLAYEHELPYALLHHTGSANFNIHARAKAKHLGLILNQYGLYYRKDDKRVRNWHMLKTEKDVLTRLEITYKEPHERNRATIRKS